ncbi:guanine nucleotide binding protein, alpha subunit [Phellopilus nigrolimitatus]|nr:guanine nucleotide binding protein, alpha subunit [Phellopilus nigrolimitatus]
MEACASVQDRTNTERSEAIDRRIEDDSLKTRDELASLRLTVYCNLLKSAQSKRRPSTARGRDPRLQARAGAGGAVAAFSEDAAGAINTLLADLIVPRIMDHSSEFYLTDNTLYFFSEVKRVGSTGYVPTETDVLRARQKSTGIIETCFNMGQLSIQMFDVGGQCSEHKNAISCSEFS